MDIHSYGNFPLVFSHIIYFHTFEDAHYSQQTFGNRIIPDTHLILLPEIIVTQSWTEVYAEWLVRHGILRRNKVLIDIFRNVQFTWRSIDNYDNMYLCVARKYDDMLWDWMKSRFISPRPARLGLLYLSIVGSQCHTSPLMHVPGDLGCCAPVVLSTHVSLGSPTASLIARFLGQYGTNLGPTGPRWARCWPHELCYLGCY